MSAEIRVNKLLYNAVPGRLDPSKRLTFHPLAFQRQLYFSGKDLVTSQLLREDCLLVREPKHRFVHYYGTIEQVWLRRYLDKLIIDRQHVFSGRIHRTTNVLACGRMYACSVTRHVLPSAFIVITCVGCHSVRLPQHRIRYI